MGTYLTDTGFNGKTQNEIIAELETEYKAIFGDDIDLDPDSGFSQQIGIFSKQLAQPWEAMAELYNSFDPDSASGVMLQKIVAINNITKLPATATSVNNVLLEGSEGTLVAAGKKAKQPFNTIEYSLLANVTITKTVAAKGLIEVDTVIVSNTYTVTIDAIPYSYIASGGDTKTDILNEIKTLIDAGTWTGAATVASEQLTLLDLTNNFSFDIGSDMLIIETHSKGNFQADTTGANTLAANSLTEIVTAVVGWDSVTNPQAGATGRELETDAELRLRRKQSVFTGNATDEAIRSSIFQDVANVTNVIVRSNRSDVTDSEGRPPHSFEAVVEGGLDTDIAEKILEIQAAGIQSYGNTTENVVDSQGYTQVIKFSRPENVYLYVRVKRNLYTEETYPTTGDALIQQAIVDWSLLTSNITIGKDVIRQRLGDPVYTVPGIKDIELALDSSTTLPYSPSYSAVNISINDRQKAVFATDRILVQSL